MTNLYIALIHYPVYNKNREIIGTCITPFDLHDIARSAYTYGIKGYYVVNPYPAQLEFAKRMLNFWQDGPGKELNLTRHDPLKITWLVSDLKEVIKDLKEKESGKLKIIGTSAKSLNGISYAKMSSILKADQDHSYLLLFGTGWGLVEDLLKDCDYILEPIYGKSEYNHLSVRSATAVILDRLLGR